MRAWFSVARRRLAVRDRVPPIPAINFERPGQLVVELRSRRDGKFLAPPSERVNQGGAAANGSTDHCSMETTDERSQKTATAHADANFFQVS